MEVSKREAEAALNEIALVSERTKKALSTGPAPAILMLWGVVWIVGYLATHFAPHLVGLIWMVVGTLGGIGSAVLGARHSRKVSSDDGFADANSKRIGWFWCVLFMYAIIWAVILNPAAQNRSLSDASRHLSAFLATIPMFAYVVGGIWLGRFYVWLGLLVTAITLIGLYALPGLFWVWMAVFGGGALLTSGIYMKQARGQL